MSHSAVELLREAPGPGGTIDATLRLACGCVVTRAVPASRLVQGEDGRRFAAGKYPCPERHPVRAPPAGDKD